METQYGIIIETNQYAGNFERELCAHLTGIIGECGVGIEYVEDEINELFHNSVMSKPDEFGCYRPVEMYKNHNNEYNNILIHFESKPTDEQLEIISERTKTFNETILKTGGFIDVDDPTLEILKIYAVKFVTTMEIISFVKK